MYARVREVGCGFFEAACTPCTTTAYLRDAPPSASRYPNRLWRILAAARMNGADDVLAALLSQSGR